MQQTARYTEMWLCGICSTPWCTDDCLGHQSFVWKHPQLAVGIPANLSSQAREVRPERTTYTQRVGHTLGPFGCAAGSFHHTVTSAQRTCSHVGRHYSRQKRRRRRSLETRQDACSDKQPFNIDELKRRLVLRSTLIRRSYTQLQPSDIVLQAVLKSIQPKGARTQRYFEETHICGAAGHAG